MMKRSISLRRLRTFVINLESAIQSGGILVWSREPASAFRCCEEVSGTGAMAMLIREWWDCLLVHNGKKVPVLGYL
ncbi:hypothetical protein REC12_16960 [Desulfosporosinus sp. PR]|nr:hypothetical protein [Desulfosporosinus sp. PR]